MIQNLGVQAAHQLVRHGGVVVGHAVLVVHQAGDMGVVAAAVLRHGAHAVLIGVVGLEVRLLAGGTLALHQRDGFVGQLHTLTHMGDDLVQQQHHGGAVFLRPVDGLNGQLVALVDGRGGQSDDTTVAAGTPSSLHHVALTGKDVASAGTHALHIHNGHRDLGHGRVTDHLLF